MSRTRRRLVLGVLVISQLLIWIDNTILGNALETLADPVRGLGATPAELQWAVGAYTLVFATLMFTAGVLGDRFGHRRVLLAGLAVFGAASCWAAYADGPGELIAARSVMGAGSAMIMPATMAAVAWTFPGEARAGAFAAFSSAAGLGVAAGPILSGALLGSFWWGSVFLVNAPVVLFGLIGVAVLVPEFRVPVARRLDLIGLMLSVSGLGLLAYSLIRAGQLAAWTGAEVWGTGLAGLALLGAFVLVELRKRTPSFDPRLLAGRVFGGGTAAQALLFLAMTAISFVSVFYLQGARGYTPLQSGLLGLPGAAGVIVGAPLANILIRRYAARAVTSIALAAAGLVMALWSLVDTATPIGWLEIMMLVQGLGIGMVIAPVTTVVLGTLDLTRMGAGSAVNNTVRQTGSVLGIALVGTVMSIVYRDAMAAWPAPSRVSAEHARHLAAATHDAGLLAAADAAFLRSYHVAALWTAGAALAGALLLAVALKSPRQSEKILDSASAMISSGVGGVSR